MLLVEKDSLHSTSGRSSHFNVVSRSTHSIRLVSTVSFCLKITLFGEQGRLSKYTLAVAEAVWGKWDYTTKEKLFKEHFSQKKIIHNAGQYETTSSKLSALVIGIH